MRLGPDGLSLSGSFTYAWARRTIPDADVLAKTLLGTVELAYPFVRRQAQTIRGSVGMDFVNQDVELDSIPLTRDRLRVGFPSPRHRRDRDRFIGPGYSTAEPPWHFTGLFELRQGLDIFGATDDCGPLGVNCLGPGKVPPSRLEGRLDATVLRYTVLRRDAADPEADLRARRCAPNMRGSRC